MARKIRQIRYYGEGLNSKNYPSDVNMSKLITGTAFKNNNQNVLITQLGIQTLPGTKFYLNDSANAIIVGNTGIYELDLEGISTINLIKFDRSSMNLINQNKMYCPITIIVVYINYVFYRCNNHFFIRML